jgi:hypothetical protein
MIRNHSLDNIALIFWSTASVIDECTFIKTMRLRIWCFLQSGPCCIQMQDRQSSVSRSSRSQQRMFNSCNKLKREDPQRKTNTDSAARIKSRFIWSFDYLKFSDIKWDIRMTSENVANLKIESQLTSLSEKFWWQCYSIRKVHCHDISVISKIMIRSCVSEDSNNIT